MTETTQTPAVEQRITLFQAIRALGWLPALFTTVVGAPSVLAILEMTIDGFRLSSAFQWIVDGYHRLTAIMSRLVEPLVAPAIEWLSNWIKVELTLHEHWRPIFLIGLLVATGFMRNEWIKGRRINTFIAGGVMAFGILFGSIVAGLVPLNGGWWAQGLIAALPIVGLWLMIGIGGFFMPFYYTIRGGIFAFFWGNVQAAFVVGVLLFVVAAATYGLGLLLTGQSLNTGIAVLAALVLLYGLGSLLAGLLNPHIESAINGLTILGGGAIATVIIMVDQLLKYFA